MSQGLPIDQKKKPAKKATVYSAFSGKTVDVLVVEDDTLFGELLVSQIQSSRLANFQPTLVRSLQESLDLLAANSFQVMLLDLFLPDSADLDTLSRIRGAYPEIPVVILTGMENHEVASAAIEQGAQDYLVKGIDKAMDRSLLYALERHRTHKALIESQTTLREAQLRLIQAEKLESIGRMAAGVAHEVKNPLAILRMGVEYLGTVLEKSRDEALTNICADMDDAVTRAQTIINGMLDFSGPTYLDLGVENLPKVVHEATRMVGHEVENRNIKLVLNFAENVPDVYIDKGKIQQVLVNLLINAAHSIDRDGEIEVHVDAQVLDRFGNGVGRRACDSFKLGQTQVTMRILDNGKGIPEEDLPKLFDPFFTSKPVGQGTGLGLPVCKNIIQLHGGQIEIKNRKEGGVAVSISLIV